MATKCIDQMPPPSVIADNVTTVFRRATDNCDAPRVSESPVNPAINATASDAAISQ